MLTSAISQYLLALSKIQQPKPSHIRCHHLKTQSQTATFDKILMEAIDETLAALGKAIETKTFLFLKTLGIKKSQIPNRISDFSEILDIMFGLGAQHLKRQILKKLHSKLGITYITPQPDSLSQEYIDSIKLKHQLGDNVEIGMIFPEEIPIMADP